MAVNVNAQTEAEVRARTLIMALIAMLRCCQDLEEPSAQIGSAIFLATELQDAVERLTNVPKPVNN
jgi:hypothetical protein